MLYRINTNVTVGGGSRRYGLGSTPNGFSLLTGLLRAREDDKRPRESRRIQPAPDYASTIILFENNTTKFKKQYQMV